MKDNRVFERQTLKVSLHTWIRKNHMESVHDQDTEDVEKNSYSTKDGHKLHKIKRLDSNKILEDFMLFGLYGSEDIVKRWMFACWPL